MISSSKEKSGKFQQAEAEAEAEGKELIPPVRFFRFRRIRINYGMKKRKLKLNF